MKGELGIKIRNISILNSSYSNLNHETTYDLRIDGEDGEFLYITGDNNIVKLLREALKEFYKNKKKEGK